MLEKKPIPPGISGLVQFRLEDRAMADIGDRYVVRSFSEGRVLGGGVILEIHPRKMKYGEPDELERLRRLETAEPREIVRQHIERLGDQTCDASSIARELAFPVGDVVDIISALRRDGEVRLLQPAPKLQVVYNKLFDDLCEKILATLDEFHRKQPHLKGMRRSDLKAKLLPSAAQILFEALLDDLEDAERIKLDGELARRSEHSITFTPIQEELKRKVTDIYLERRFNTPDLNELAAELGLQPSEVEPIVVGLCELGDLMKLHGPEGKPFYFHRETVEMARHLLLEFFKEHNEMRFFEFRELIGSSRKYTTPILMYFDDTGLTYRAGDVRRLRKK